MSTSLDFKRDQYPLATDEQKGEFIKDILAFANSWRRSDAYVLIGVDDVKGGRSAPVGVSTHLNDADIQQLVNSKTNRKIEFRYVAVPVDGKSIGAIHIAIQDRPSYLSRAFGKLAADTVYIRRGSSTDVARRDEIAKMGARTDLRHPRLELVPRIVHHPHLGVILSIRNELGAGPARAPRLSIAVPGPFSECDFGVDGNGKFGLTRVPQGQDSGVYYLLRRHYGRTGRH